MAFDRFPSDFATLVVPPFDSELDNFKASLDKGVGRATLGKKLWVTWWDGKYVFSDQISDNITQILLEKTFFLPPHRRQNMFSQIKSEPERDSPDVPRRPEEL